MELRVRFACSLSHQRADLLVWTTILQLSQPVWLHVRLLYLQLSTTHHINVQYNNARYRKTARFFVCFCFYLCVLYPGNRLIKRTLVQLERFNIETKYSCV